MDVAQEQTWYLRSGKKEAQKYPTVGIPAIAFKYRVSAEEGAAFATTSPT